MEAIDIRELEQHASRYLARVEAGEELGVTNNGRLIARIIPAGDAERSREALVESGVLVPARCPGNISTSPRCRAMAASPIYRRSSPRCAPSSNPSARASSPQNRPRRPLRDEHHRRVGVPRRDGGHRRGIDHPKSRDPVHPTIGVQHRR